MNTTPCKPDASAGQLSTADSRPISSSALTLLDLVTFSAKVDYLTIQLNGKRDLPELDGKLRWVASSQYKKVSIHDPTARDVAALLRCIGAAPLLELEVAVDARAIPGATAEERIEMLSAVMRRFAKTLEPSAGKGMRNQFRASFRRVGARGIVNPFNRRLPDPTDQLLYGGRGDPAQTKCYFKQVDQGDSLSEEGFSARMEVRLSGALAEHGLGTLEDLLGFRFRRKLAPYFRAMSGTQRLISRRGRNPYGAAARAKLSEFDAEEWAEVGVGGFVDGGRRSNAKVRLLRDTEFNDRVGQALLRLERQFSREKFVCPDDHRALLSPDSVILLARQITVRLDFGMRR